MSRGRPNNQLSEHMDYSLNPSGRIAGYNGQNVVNSGVSTFGWAHTPSHPQHGVTASELLPYDCTILERLSEFTYLVQDYSIQFRYDEKGKRKEKEVPHFSICPIGDDLYTPNEWTELIYGSDENSCLWLPCTMKAVGENLDEDGDIADGCDENDTNYFTKSAHFAVRALYLVCRAFFPKLCLHDKLIVNGLLTKLSQTKPATLQAAMREMNVQFLRAILTILQQTPCEGATAINYCGIIISEIEEFLFPENDSEEYEITSSMSKFVLVTYASIDFIVFTPDLPDQKCKALPNFVMLGNVKIDLDKPDSNRDLELDPLVRGKIMNDDQVASTDSNPVVIEVNEEQLLLCLLRSSAVEVSRTVLRNVMVIERIKTAAGTSFR